MTNRTLAEVLHTPLTDEAVMVVVRKVETRIGYRSPEETEQALIRAAGIAVAEVILAKLDGIAVDIMHDRNKVRYQTYGEITGILEKAIAEADPLP